MWDHNLDEFFVVFLFLNHIDEIRSEYRVFMKKGLKQRIPHYSQDSFENQLPKRNEPWRFEKNYMYNQMPVCFRNGLFS